MLFLNIILQTICLSLVRLVKCESRKCSLDFHLEKKVGVENRLF